MWAAKLVKKLAETDPEKRRLYAARILIGSIVGWIATHLMFLLMGITGAFEHVLNLISWWAITLTAWDILATSDVKVDTDEAAAAAAAAAS
ncbi:MAG TPA: hypothetical protein VFZ06_02150 [Acidimicrobiia bacterium]|nr:hypothetical protein [Acidimicrobiia bacterium]